MKDKLKLIRLLFQLYKCPYSEEIMWIWNSIIRQKRKIAHINDNKPVG